MNQEQQVGLVKRTKILKELRHVVRDQESRSGQWAKIKPILDNVKIGDRDDIVMIRNDRRGLVELAVVTYRELLGATARVRIAPMLSANFRGVAELEADNWSACIVEVTARLMEFHSVVTASDGDRLDIVTTGRPALKEQLDAAISDIFRMNIGIEVLLNGEPIETSEMSSDLWPPENGPPPSIMLPIAFKWPESEADQHGEARRKLRLSTSSEWLDDVPFFERSTDVEFYDGHGNAIERCVLSATTDAALIERGLVGSNISNIAQLGLGLYKIASDCDHGSIITAWVDQTERLAGFLTVIKTVAILAADDETWHVGLEYLFGFHPGAELDTEELGQLMGVGLRAALVRDIVALGNSGRAHTKRVVIDVLLNTPTERDNHDFEYILDAALDNDDTLEIDALEGVEVGEVKAKVIDKAMFRSARPPGFQP
jgi:hypothetical protein